jgi:hypothetical protein
VWDPTLSSEQVRFRAPQEKLTSWHPGNLSQVPSEDKGQMKYLETKEWRFLQSGEKTGVFIIVEFVDARREIQSHSRW